MEVVSHKAIAVELEWFPLLEVGEGLEKGGVVSFAVKHRLAIIATVDDVVDQPSAMGRRGRGIPAS